MNVYPLCNLDVSVRSLFFQFTGGGCHNNLEKVQVGLLTLQETP